MPENSVPIYVLTKKVRHRTKSNELSVCLDAGWFRATNEATMWDHTQPYQEDISYENSPVLPLDPNAEPTGAVHLVAVAPRLGEDRIHFAGWGTAEQAVRQIEILHVRDYVEYLERHRAYTIESINRQIGSLMALREQVTRQSVGEYPDVLPLTIHGAQEYSQWLADLQSSGGDRYLNIEIGQNTEIKERFSL